MNNNTKAKFKTMGGKSSQNRPRRSTTQARLSRHAKVAWNKGADGPRQDK